MSKILIERSISMEIPRDCVLILATHGLNRFLSKMQKSIERSGLPLAESARGRYFVLLRDLLDDFLVTVCKCFLRCFSVCLFDSV